MMVWKMYILSNMAVLGIYVRFQGGTHLFDKVCLAEYTSRCVSRNGFPQKIDGTLVQFGISNLSIYSYSVRSVSNSRAPIFLGNILIVASIILSNSPGGYSDFYG